MYDCRYWLWLSLAFEPGSVKCDTLLQRYNYNPKAIYEAAPDDYEFICKDNPRLLSALSDKSLDKVHNVLQFCEKNNVGILTPDDNRYPSPLLRIHGQPPVIYYKGTIPDFSKNLTIGVVGTRDVSSYGKSAAYTISHDLAYAGAIVVSGMAIGTDTAAHRGALDAKGKTIAFLGCGIDIIYPRENARLMEEITENGAVMTDYPPSSRPEGRHFPVRNRLISGVSHGIFVVEAASKSGALITAEHALNQGKLLYSLPGRIGERTSQGTNRLLISGAKAVTSTEDILADFRTLFRFRTLENQSGYTQYRPAPAEELSKPYKTPVFNPYANKQKAYSESAGNSNLYNNFMPYPENTKEAEKADSREAPQKEKQINKFLPRYFDPSAGNQKSNTLNQPKPIIIYNDFDDEEYRKAAESLSESDKENLKNIEMLTHRPVLRYPETPMPEGGYSVTLTEEKIAEFDRMSEEAKNRRLNIGEGIKIESPVKCVTDLHELKKLYESDKRSHEERKARTEEAKANGITDYSGLSNVEISVLKLLEAKGKITVDSMSELGIPISKLLSVLSFLEIKRRIIQYPGGYYEINRDY